MAEDACRASDRAVRSDTRAARNGGTPGHRRMGADAHVMADLDLVVQLDAVLDHRVVERAAVDRRVGADLDVVAYKGTPRLRNLDPAPRIARHAETVGADHHAGMNQCALADEATRIDGHRRSQAAVLADLRVFTDGAIGIDHGALAQPRSAADMTARAHRGRCGDFGARFDHRARMDSRNAATLRVEKLCGPGVVDIGVVAQDPGQGRRVPLLSREDHGRGAGAPQLRAVAGVRKEAKVAGAGAFQGGDSPDLGIGIAYQFPAEPGDDLTQPVGTRDGLRHGGARPSHLTARGSSSALMTLSVMSMRGFAHTTCSF